MRRIRLYEQASPIFKVYQCRGNIVGDTFSINGTAQASGLTAADIFAETDANSAAGGGKLVLLGGNTILALNEDTANPAIDGGDDSLAPSTDARGIVRFDQADIANNGANISDLGAFEFAPLPPVAGDDSAAGNEDNVISGDVSSNDTDPEGDALTYTVDTGPANGSVTLNSDGSFDYTPNTNFNGSDAFAYTVSDGNGGTDTALVNITVNPVNDYPVAIDDNVSGDEDTLITGNTNANDGDVDGDTLWYVLRTGGEPTHGSVELNRDGTFSYIPDTDFNGTDSFTYNVVDGKGGWDTATVTITVNPVNDLPLAADDVVSGDEDTVISGDVSSNDNDPEGDSLTYALNTGPANGSVTVNSDGSFDYTPDANFNGSDSFIYSVSDGNGADTATVDITVNPVIDAPVAEDDSFTTDEDTSSAVMNLLANDINVDGDSLSIQSIAATTLTPGTAQEIVVTNGTVNVSALGEVTFTPDENYNGPVSFDYVVSDGNGGTDTATVTGTVNAVNDAPVVENLSTWVLEDSSLNWNIQGYVSDVESVLSDGVWTFELGTDATHGDVQVYQYGSFSYHPDANYFGTDSFTYFVNDGDGGRTEATVNLEVRPINDAPVVTLTLNGSVAENVEGAMLGTFTISDVDDTEFDIYVSDTKFGTERLEFIDNGDHYAIKLKDGQSFDYEADGSSVRLIAEVYDDTEADLAFADLTITDVNDVAPHDITLSNLNVVENDTGATIGTLAAIDEDGPSLAFTVSDDRFEIVSDVLKLKDGISLDRESEPELTVTVTASDGTFEDTKDFTLTVQNVDEGGPENLALTNSSIDENSTGLIGTLSATDVDGDAISFSVSDSRFAITGNELRMVKPQNYEALTNGLISLEITATAAGVATTRAFVITVNDINEAPSLTASFGSYEGYTDSVWELSVLENSLQATFYNAESGEYPIALAATDLEGDALLFVLSGADAEAFTVDESTGALMFAENPDYEAPADSNGDGTYEVIVTASDGTLESNSITFNLSLLDVAEAPEAINDIASGDEDTVIQGDVSANDTDPDGGALSYAAETTPAHGALTLNSDGTFEYTPNANFNGNDSFDYLVTDVDGNTDTATVNLTVNAVNDAPILGGDVFAGLIEDEVLSASGTLTVTDLDGAQEEAFQPLVSSTDYGTFSLNASGAWSFTLDNEADAVQSLDTGNIHDLTFTADSADDSASIDITVRVNGIDEANGNGGNPKGDANGSGGTQTGEAGNDIIEGGTGKDVLFGGLGDDVLFGFEGSDELFGQEGDDQMLGGTGNDVHTGGAGADMFFFEAGGGKDTVLDFEIGVDRIGLKASDGLNAEDLRVKLQKSGDIQIAYSGDAMLLEGSFSDSDVDLVGIYVAETL